MPLPRLHLVTDDAVLQDAQFLTHAQAVMTACGADLALHLRGHATSGRTLHTLGEALATMALQTGAWLFVNDRVDIARAIRAHGAQLGRRSIPIADARAQLGHGAHLGYSAHGALEAGEAATEGADFVVVGTIYASASHTAAAAAGIGRLEESVAAARVPVLAIGGISEARVAAVATAGGYGVAVLSGVWQVADPRTAAVAYVRALRAVYAPARERSMP